MLTISVGHKPSGVVDMKIIIRFVRPFLSDSVDGTGQASPIPSTVHTTHQLCQHESGMLLIAPTTVYTGTHSHFLECPSLPCRTPTIPVSP
jgi:hypothetical protein